MDLQPRFAALEDDGALAHSLDDPLSIFSRDGSEQLRHDLQALGSAGNLDEHGVRGRIMMWGAMQR